MSNKNRNIRYFINIENRPLNGCDKGIIYCEKIDKGHLVEGECHIIEDCVDIIDERIREWKKKYKKKPFDYVETNFH